MHFTARRTLSDALYFEKPDNQRSNCSFLTDWNDVKAEHDKGEKHTK